MDMTSLDQVLRQKRLPLEGGAAGYKTNMYEENTRTNYSGSQLISYPPCIQKNIKRYDIKWDPLYNYTVTLSAHVSTTW